MKELDTAAADALRGLIEAGDRLIEAADIIGQPIAAAHMSLAIDILRAHLRLAAEVGQSVLQNRAHQVDAPRGE